MNWDTIRGNWNEYKGRLKEQWGRLVEDDLEVVDGRRDQFIGRMQRRHGLAKAKAERRIKAPAKPH